MSLVMVLFCVPMHTSVIWTVFNIHDMSREKDMNCHQRVNELRQFINHVSISRLKRSAPLTRIVFTEACDMIRVLIAIGGCM